MNEATNGFSRVIEYKRCAIDPVSTAGSWAPRWTREGKGTIGFRLLLHAPRLSSKLS
jgi:hypothetical protein